jgi:two-component system sensor histidine kinase/response regulator
MPVSSGLENMSRKSFLFLQCWLRVVVLCSIFSPYAYALEPDDSVADEVVFSQSEKEWLARHGNISLGVAENDYPYERLVITPGGDRHYEGIVSDYVKYINRVTGLKMYPSRVLSWEVTLPALELGEVDVLPMVVRTPELEQYLLFSQPYMCLKLGIVATNGGSIRTPEDIRGKTIATVKNYAYEYLLKDDFSTSVFLLFNNAEEALRAVASGRADAYAGDFFATGFLLNRLGLDNLKLIGATPYEIDICFGVRKDWPELAGIIDKVLDSIGNRRKSHSFRYWTRGETSKRAKTTDWSLIWEVASGGVVGVLLLVMVFILWNRSLGREIVERRKAEVQLRNNIQLLETLFDTIPGPVFYVGINGDFLGCNKAFCDDITGVSREDMKDKSIYDVIARENGEKVTLLQNHTSQLIQHPGVQTFDVDLVCTDGIVRDFSVYSATFKRNGRESGIINLMLDVSDKKKVEKELLLAKNAAEAATNAKSNFVANMSHELRTPLNAVIGISHLIMQTELTDKQHNYLEKIDSASRHLLGVINDILDFSKIEAGKMNIEAIDFNIKKLCQDINDMFAAKAREKDLKLSFCISPRIPRKLKGDPLRLKQILINLVSNAIKFTNHGEVVLLVEPGRKRGRKLKVKFTVQDTGIGMSEEQVELLFVPFTQADDSMTRKFGGTGLGLVITKSLIEIMNGTLEVESTLNVGSSFSFDVELEADMNDQETTDTSTVIPINRITVKNKNLEKLRKIQGAKVLLVEDNAINRQVAMEMLIQVGMSVETAENGQEAVERIVEGGQQYDAVFMDVQMPVMDGYKATELIREINSQLPIIALTAHVMPAAIKRCLQSGMNDHLNKPLNPELLYSTLLKWIKPGQRVFANSAVNTDAEKSQVKPELCDMPGLNISAALEPVEGDTALMKQLLDTFRKDFGNEGVSLLNSLKNNDWDSLKNALHKIKGSASYIGAEEIRDSAAYLEEKLINGHTVSKAELNVISLVVDSIAILIGKPTVAH